MKTRSVVLLVAGSVAALCCIGAGIFGALNATPTPGKSTAATTSPPPAATAQAAPKKYSETAKFPTGRYADEVRTKIDDLVTAKDCAGLQAEFNRADANDAAQRAKTGSGTADLMTYIDGALKAANCH